MQITTNAKLINRWKGTKESKGRSTDFITVHVQWFDDVPEKSYAPYGTKPGAYINFEKNMHLIEAGDFIAGDHVSISFLLSCGEYQGNYYTKVTGISMDKIDTVLPFGSLFSSDEDTPFDRDPVTKQVL